MNLLSNKLTRIFTTGLILVSLIFLPARVLTQISAPAQQIGRLHSPPSTVQSDPATLARLATQKAILNAQRVTNLSALGTLTISGTVVPQPGFVRAAFVRNVGAQITEATSAILTTRNSSAAINRLGPVSSAAAAIQSRPITSVANAIQPRPDASVADAIQSTPLKPSNMTTAPTTVGSARGLNRSAAPAHGEDGTSSLPAVKIIGEPLLPPGQTGSSDTSKTAATLPIFTAYWVGGSINLPANTTIVIQPNVRYLVLIANTITVGSNVVITYEDVPVMNGPAVPGKPTAVPGKPSTPNPFTAGYGGGQGYNGTQPPQIATPPDAPQVEVWTLTMNQLPTMILKGQHGYKGVPGGMGGDGGPGGNGSNSNPGTFQCHDGPGNGGNGGKGGRGADGGQGGNGGTGGVCSLYLPTFPTSMMIDVSGGERGEGGDPGQGGSGGPGGSRGSINGTCANQNWSTRHDGAGGPGGDSGVKGADGAPGIMLPNSINQFVLNPSDFIDKLDDPAIQHIYPEYPNTATVGSTITIEGLNFTPTDTVTVGGVSAPTQFLSNTMLQAIVPNTWGGVAPVKVVPLTGSASNSGTLYIKSVIVSTVPSSSTSRLKPGSTIVVNGTGFSPQMSVRVNHEDIANVSPSSPTTLSFVMARPASIPHNAANAGGEPAVLSVASSGPIIESDSIPIVIATFQIVVIGDSIIWSEGLQDADKIHSLVEAYEKTLYPGMSVYKKVEAHTGAVLGWNSSVTGTAHDGDIPQDYPSVQQQASTLATLPNASTVDLVLVVACANDVGFKHFLDPLATHASIDVRVNQFCFADMSAFLGTAANQFPAAKIVVAGYYQGLSPDTDPGYFVSLAGVMYGLQNNQGLEPKMLAAAVGITLAGRLNIVDNAGYFASRANIQLANAVNAANAGLTTQRIFFADPGFGPTNAANASNAWVFGLSPGLIPGPTDSSASLSRRLNECGGVYNTSSFDYMFCKLASTGHPNETGALKYFNAIKPLL